MRISREIDNSQEIRVPVSGGVGSTDALRGASASAVSAGSTPVRSAVAVQGVCFCDFCAWYTAGFGDC